MKKQKKESSALCGEKSDGERLAVDIAGIISYYEIVQRITVSSPHRDP
jgi:hypothetical protein